MLIYAQRGHGRRASLYTDYTFGVWDEGELVPFAKAYSGLTDAEIREVDPSSGATRSRSSGRCAAVKPELVFELGFEGDPALGAAQVRHRRALPAHPALAHRQDHRSGGHSAAIAGDSER